LNDQDDEYQKPHSGSKLMSESRLSSKLTLGLSRVLILGVGWSGIKVAAHLAQANVGKIILVDEDKTVLKAAAETIQNNLQSGSTGSTTEFVCHELDFDAHFAEELINDVTMVIDCLENWQDKLLASDVCMQLRKTLIHAGSSGNGMRFQIYAMRPGKSACLRCAFPLAGIDDVPLIPESNEHFEPIVAMVAAMQSLEAIKIMSRLGVSQGNELLKFDGLSGEFEIIRGLDPQHGCPDCGFAR
jgi:molybdopterin/thiamine biosynthesis adenylyltransferase